MSWNPTYQPVLRPVEAFRWDGEDGDAVGLRDVTGLSDVVLSMSEPVLMALSMMDGTATCQQIQQHFQAETGQPVSDETLQVLLNHLQDAHFLEGPAFESHYQTLVDDYRAQDARLMHSAESLGIDDTGQVFKDMLNVPAGDVTSIKVQGIVAPHLDYPRGKPCYAAAYGALSRRAAPDRIIILGTNHFGRGQSVVATGKAFQTPLGRTRTDTDFLERLEKKCGPMRTFELEHAHEHSVELQVAWLQFLFGADRFEMVPFLCPDPSAASCQDSSSQEHIDLNDFANALRDEIELDAADTLIVAGADLSHVGAAFGDEHQLTEEFLAQVEQKDRESLDKLLLGHSDAFIHTVAQDGNQTRVCSAGCMSVISRVLKDAKVSMLGYHQAVDQSTQTCVTCSALLFT